LELLAAQFEKIFKLFAPTGPFWCGLKRKTRGWVLLRENARSVCSDQTIHSKVSSCYRKS